MKYNTIKIGYKAGKYNYYTITDKKRHLLSDWVDHCWEFRNGFGIVLKDSRFNYVKPDGTFLLPEWVEECFYFRDGFGKYRKDGVWYKIDKYGNIKEINEIYYD